MGNKKPIKRVSAKLDMKLKRLYPEGRALDNDRLHNAKIMLEPTKKNIEYWKDNKNKADIKGFDDKVGKEETVSKLVKKVSRGVVGYIEQEAENGNPERFVDTRYVAGKLIAENKDKIKDFNSMRDIIKSTWARDTGGLDELAPQLTLGDLEVLFNTDTIQDYIDENTRPEMINYIMKKYKVEPVKASRVLNRLTPKVKQKMYQYQKRIRLPKIRVSGRTRPTRARWTKQERNFIKTNNHLSDYHLHRLFNNVFDIKRSRNAISKVR